MKAYSSAELIKLAKNAGWVFKRAEGSHHHFRHPDFVNTLTIPHPKKDISIGTARNIIKQIKGQNT